MIKAKNKILSIILAICMVVSIVPATSMTAFAADEPTTSWGDHADTGSITDWNATEITINTAEELAYLAKLVSIGEGETVEGITGNNFQFQTITLADDLDLSAHEWVPIGTGPENFFGGTFNGGGHEITGLYIDNLDQHYQGLFGFLNRDGTIQNIGVAGTVTGTKWVGGVVGINEGGTITNSHSSAVVVGTSYVGGIAGDNRGTITNSYNTGNVTGTQADVGGITGYSYGYIANCFNTATIYSERYAGGIAGFNIHSTVANSYNTGDVTSGISSVGGVVGNNSNSTVVNSYNIGNTTSTFEAGSVVGRNFADKNATSTVKNSYYLENGSMSGVYINSKLDETSITTNTNIGSFSSGSSAITWDTVNDATNDNSIPTTSLLDALNKGAALYNQYGSPKTAADYWEIGTGEYTYPTHNLKGILANKIYYSNTIIYGNALPTATIADEYGTPTITYAYTQDGETVETPSDVGQYAYTITVETATHKGVKTGTLNITQSGTDFVDGGIKTYKGNEETTTTTFTYGDIITVKAKPEATGNAPITTFSLVEPQVNQMALFATINGTETQISDPVSADSNGMYTMSYDTTSALLTVGSQNTIIAKYFGNTNMANFSANVTITLNKANSSVATAPTAKTLKYTGSSQELVNAGTATGGEIQYSLTENGTYSTTIPTGTDLGDYTVYYKVVGDDNYNDTAVASVNVTINKGDAPSIAFPTASGITYGQKLSDSIFSKTSDEFGTFVWANVDTVPTVTNSGYEVIFTPSQATIDNYEAITNTTSNVNVTVAKATITITANNKSAYVNDTAPDLATPTLDTDYTVSGLVGVEELGRTVTLAYENTPDMSKTGTVKIIASGATAPSADNYNDIVYVDGTLTVSNRPSSGGGGSSSSSSTDTLIEKIEDADDNDTIETTLSTSNPTLDKEVLENLAGKDVTLEVKYGDVTWIIEGNELDEDFDFKDMNFKVSLNTNKIPAILKNEITGEVSNIELDITHDGEFGFPVKLAVDLDEENADLFANIFYFDEETDDLDYIQTVKTNSDGIAIFDLDHASTYVISLSETDLTPKSFDDVNENDWFYEFVLDAVNKGLFAGTSDTTFSPNANATRAMVVTILHRIEGEPEVELMYGNFGDVVQKSWYEMAVAWAAKEGFVSGVGEGMFAPDDAITREQFVTILYKYEAPEMATMQTMLGQFTDESEISEYAVSAMEWAVANGIITGKTENTLDPKGYLTRAEMATILLKFTEEE